MKPLFAFLLALTLTGCASTVGDPQRSAGLAYFLGQPAPEILAYRRSLTVDQSLVALMQERSVIKLTERFALEEEDYALLRDIQEAAPRLENGVANIFTGDNSADAEQKVETLVLFVSPTWQVTYQRLPPRLDLLRLELGVIAKVIPRRQVMEGRGNLALRTAYWETRCHKYALDGEFFSVSEWLADDAALWRAGLAEVRHACSQEIAKEFEKSTAAFDGMGPRTNH